MSEEYSDSRLKDIDGKILNAMDKVLAISGYYYKPNHLALALGAEDVRQVGLVTQEVEEILPEVVTESGLGDGFKTIHYGRMIALLVEAIKEQQEEIDQLRYMLNG